MPFKIRPSKQKDIPVQQLLGPTHQKKTVLHNFLQPLKGHQFRFSNRFFPFRNQLFLDTRAKLQGCGSLVCNDAIQQNARMTLQTTKGTCQSIQEDIETFLRILGVFFYYIFETIHGSFGEWQLSWTHFGRQKPGNSAFVTFLWIVNQDPKSKVLGELHGDQTVCSWLQIHLVTRWPPIFPLKSGQLFKTKRRTPLKT